MYIDPETGKAYVKIKPRGILAFGVNLLTEDEDGNPTSKFYEVASAGLIDALPAEDWYFVGGSSSVVPILHLVDGEPQQRYLIKFRLFGAKYSNLTNDPAYFEQEFTLPTTFLETPTVGGGQELSTNVYNYRSVRGVMELSPSDESEPLGVVKSLDYLTYRDMSRFPICATPPYDPDINMLKIHNRSWRFYVGRRPYPVGTQIHDGLADDRSETVGFWPTPLMWHSSKDSLGLDPYHGLFGEFKVVIGKGSTVHDAAAQAMYRKPINAEFINNGRTLESTDGGPIWPSNLVPSGSLSENTDWLAVGSEIDYYQQVETDVTADGSSIGYVNEKTGNSTFFIAKSPGFDHGFYRAATYPVLNNVPVAISSPQMRLDYNTVYRFQAIVRPYNLITSSGTIDRADIIVSVQFDNGSLLGYLDGHGNPYQSGDAALWDPILKIWVSRKSLATYGANRIASLFHMTHFYGQPVDLAAQYLQNHPEDSTKHLNSFGALSTNHTASLAQPLTPAQHKIAFLSTEGLALAGAGSIAFDVGVGDEYPGLDRQMMGSYSNHFRAIVIIQHPSGWIFYPQFHGGGTWDIGEVVIRNKTVTLAQAMRGQALLDLSCSTQEIPDTSGTTTVPVIGSQGIIIHDNPAFMDWSL
jgi:hypothetical protein